MLLNKKETLYCGLDLYPPAHIIGNLEKGIPFGDASFDTVVALDVLEHTDNIHEAFKELCRVARKNVLITLPNVYEIKSRIRFLLGKQLSGKYGLPSNFQRDRHRWFFSLQEARTFIHEMGRLQEFEVETEGCIVGPHRGFAGGWRLVNLFPNLLSPCYVVFLVHRKIA